MSTKGRGFEQLNRTLAVLQFIRGARLGRSAEEIHEWIETTYPISLSVLHRDLKNLSTAGFLDPKPKTWKKGETWKWKIAASNEPSLSLFASERELIALYLSKSALTPLRDTPFYQDIKRVFQQIEALLGARKQKYLSELSSQISFEPGPAWALGVSSDVVDTVHASCSEGHILQFIYESNSSGTTKQRKVGPHFLYISKGSLYLVGEDCADHLIKVFALPRMSAVQMTDLHYEGKRSDPQEFFRNSFGVFTGSEVFHVKLRFVKKTAAFVRERRWHNSQKVTARSDGTAEMTLEVALTPELVSWVMSFGPDVEVVGPSQLRDSVINQLKETTKIYSVA